MVYPIQWGGVYPIQSWLMGYPIQSWLEGTLGTPIWDLSTLPRTGVPLAGTWDQSLGYPPERTWNQWKHCGMEMGYTPWKGHLTGGSIMGWRWGIPPSTGGQSEVKTLPSIILWMRAVTTFMLLMLSYYCVVTCLTLIAALAAVPGATEKPCCLTNGTSRGSWTKT